MEGKDSTKGKNYFVEIGPFFKNSNVQSELFLDRRTSMREMVYEMQFLPVKDFYIIERQYSKYTHNEYVARQADRQ